MTLETLLILAQAKTEATSPGWAQLLMFVPIFVIFYFLLIRPQMKRQKEMDNMQKGLKSGDQVATVGGIIGTVTSIRENIVVLRIAENVKIEVQRAAITETLKSKDAPLEGEVVGKEKK